MMRSRRGGRGAGTSEHPADAADTNMWYSNAMTDPRPWPRNWKPYPQQRHGSPPTIHIPRGLPVLSRSKALRGYTLGVWQPCPVKACRHPDGHRNPQIGVHWETDQVFFICQAGWELHNQPEPHILIVDGGEVSARYVNPREPATRRHQMQAHTDTDWLRLGWNPHADPGRYHHSRLQVPSKQPRTMTLFDWGEQP